MSHAEVTTRAGSKTVNALPRIPFDATACAFLATLSAFLRADEAANKQPDVMTFAFWCRGGNIEKLKTRYAGLEKRLGRGLAFHIAPSNVPINFAYSFAFSLLAGNANIVRLPSRDLPQVDILCLHINNVLKKSEFASLQHGMAFIRYAQNNDITAHYSALCDMRIIWGGDATVSQIRQLPISPRALELVFPDRYSFCVMSPDAVINLSDEQLAHLADGFYNDTYLMDQNACSSPHLVVWLEANKEKAAAARIKFWTALRAVVRKRYSLAAVQAIDKYASLLGTAIHSAGHDQISLYGNEVYTVALENLPASLTELRGKFGLFYEFVSDSLKEIGLNVTDKFQTLTTFGVDKDYLQDFVIENRLRGIDRIVPVGQALDIDIVWDGQDIIRHLSRIVDAR